MNYEEFRFQFARLTKAFQINRPEERADIYFEELKKISATTFSECCRRAIRDGERFPTIANLLQMAESIQPTRKQNNQSCHLCDGSGTISLWGHTFKTRCIHGQALSKSIAFEPETENDRKKWYINLSNDWQKTYGKELPYEF